MFWSSLIWKLILTFSFSTDILQILVTQMLAIKECWVLLKAGLDLGKITSWKQLGTQNQKCPNRDIKFPKSKITGKDSICSKQLKLKEKIREINLLIDMQISLQAKLYTIISCCLSSNCHGIALRKSTGMQFLNIILQSWYMLLPPPLSARGGGQLSVPNFAKEGIRKKWVPGGT